MSEFKSTFKTVFKSIFRSIFGDRSFGKISPIWHGMRGILASVWFGSPSKKMNLIGITGTKGKTSTTILTSRLLNYFGSPTGFFSTALMFDGKVETQNPTHMSTIDPWELQKFLQKCHQNGCQNMVLELSSQGLEQNRHWGVMPLQIAAFLNIYPEHIQAHGSWENYQNCKARLFGMLKNGGTAIANGEPKMRKNSDFMLKNLRPNCTKIFIQKINSATSLFEKTNQENNPKISQSSGEKTQFYDILQDREFHKTLIWPANYLENEENEKLVSNSKSQNPENKWKTLGKMEKLNLAKNSQNLESKIESKNEILKTSELQKSKPKNSQIISKIVLKTQMVADYELTNLAFALTIAQSLSVENSVKIQTEMSKNPEFILQISPKIPGRMEWLVIDNELVA